MLAPRLETVTQVSNFMKVQEGLMLGMFGGTADILQLIGLDPNSNLMIA